MKRSLWCALPSSCICLHLWATAVFAGNQTLADLLIACHAGDCQAVRTCLQEKQELARQTVITEQSERGYTAMDAAARGGYVEIVRLLLAAGADVNSRAGAAARTPLMQVGLHACGKEPELPADLIKALALPEQPTAAQSEHSGQAAPACTRNHLQCLRLLINSGADIDATDSQNRSTLYHCANGGNSEALCLLAEQGAKVGGWSSHANDPLNAAAFEGHLACVQALVSAGALIAAARKNDFSPLNDAVQNGHEEIVQYLLQKGVSANAESAPNGGMALLLAAQKGYLVCMQTLLAAGADIKGSDCDGKVALYYAARWGQLAALEMLLSRGAKVQGWSSCKNDPLCVAAFYGHLDCVRALVNAGAAITTGRKHGFSAVNAAAQNGHVEILQYLLQQGVSVNAESAPDGGTPLLVASQEGQLSCIQVLLEAGADINRPNSTGATALYGAAYEGQLGALQLLLASGVKVQGWSASKTDPLCTAAFNGHLDCVQALVGAGTPITTGKKYGFSALNRAAQKGHVKILQYLLQQGVSANAESSPVGGAPLLVAIQTEQLACMELLLDAGAKINRPDCNGYTALHGAASRGLLTAVHYLLERGAAVNCRNRYGCTPLFTACQNGREAVVAMLLKAGADPKMAVGGETPLYLAAMGGHVEMVDQLLAAGADPLERSGISRFFRGNSLDHSVRKKRDSATEAGERKRYATIVHRLQQFSIELRRPHRTAMPITEKTPLLS